MKDYKKRFYWNIVQIIIGLTLLFIVYLWVRQYPAEWNAFKIQFSVLYDQAKVLYYSIFTNVGNQVKERQNLQRSYKSLIDLAKNAGCLTWNDLKDFEDFYKKMESLSLQEYLNNIDNIRANLVSRYEYIRLHCPNINFPN